jgi:hypothetical protein
MSRRGLKQFSELMVKWVEISGSEIECKGFLERPIRFEGGGRSGILNTLQFQLDGK